MAGYNRRTTFSQIVVLPAPDMPVIQIIMGILPLFFCAGTGAAPILLIEIPALNESRWRSLGIYSTERPPSMTMFWPVIY